MNTKSTSFAVVIILCQSIIFSNFIVVAEDDSSSFSRINTNATEFTYYAASNVDSVEVAGEWDDWLRHNLSYSNGIFSIDLEIEPGFYCYKIIIDQNNWILDPSNEYRKYCDGIMNSGIIVEDFSNPKISIIDESQEVLNLKLDYTAGTNGSEVSEIEVYLMHNFERQNISYTWNEEDWTFDININFSAISYERGKYTLNVQALDLEGRKSNALSYPFWFEEDSFDWNGALIYMIMTDRFINGNTSNDPELLQDASQGADWFGGDFAGVISMLESGYFQDLGVSALWLTPFNKGADGTYMASDNDHRVSSYHGYWPVKSREIDHRLGTENELKQLIALAHSQGIRIINDFVINHVHENHEYYQNNPEWFRDGCVLGTAGCDWTERALDGVFSSYMPDVNWQNPEVSEKFLEDAIWWQKEFDLDGSRIDAVKHVEPSAISNLVVKFNYELENSLTDYYLIGETAMGWSGDNLVDNLPQYNAINQYMGEGGLDGQGDFVLYHAVVDNVFSYESKDFNHLDYWTLQSQQNYLEGSLMTPYLGSHDVSRLISRLDSDTNNQDNKWVEQGLPQQPSSSQPYVKAKTAFSWLFTIPGVPVLYMGDEYGEYGGSDPDNRHPFRQFHELNSNEKALLSSVQELGMLRSNLTDLQKGLYRSVFSDSNLLVFSRGTSDSQTLVLINSGGDSREVLLNKGDDIFYHNYLDVRNNLSISAVNDSLSFAVNSNDFSIYRSTSQSIIDDSSDNDIDNSTDTINNETNESDDNLSEPLINENNEAKNDDKEEDSNSDTLLNDNLDEVDVQKDDSEAQTPEPSNIVSSDNQEGDSLLLLRGLLFITFLSLIITFVYTRRG